MVDNSMETMKKWGSAINHYCPLVEKAEELVD